MEEYEEPLVFLPDTETTCHKCYAEFLEPEDLAIHLKQMHQSTKSCQLCSTPYTDMCDYAKHIKYAHLVQLKYCRICTKVFLNNSSLKLHIAKHTSKDSDIVNCSQCSRAFSTTAELESHEYENHLNNTDGVMLQGCYRELSSYVNMRADAFLLALSKHSAMTCVTCNYSTLNVNNYVKHLDKKKCRVKVCDICMNVYKNKTKLMQHMARHRQFSCYKARHTTKRCPQCDKDVSLVRFKEHRKICKTLRCMNCSRVFPTLQELSEHQSNAHPSSLELRTCRFCHRECVGEDVLRKHIKRIHKNHFSQYKYLCVYCDTLFKHPKKLFGHFFTKHKGINPYTCKICNTNFRLRKRFTLHIKLEHGSKGFVEFDENYHVFFTEQKSKEPFIPKSILTNDNCMLSDDRYETDIDKPIKKQGERNENAASMDATETEGNVTEQQRPKKKKIARKRRVKKLDKTVDIVLSSSEDDQPLVKMKSKSELRPAFSNDKMIVRNRRQFTCKKCGKYCYTYQNYHNHLSLHSRHETKRCIKCLKDFTNKADLQQHIAKEHSSSKLTETLKSILEKRKTGSAPAEPNNTQKFQMTVRKAPRDPIVHTPAKVTLLPRDGLSVQRFIENFTPEPDARRDVKISNCVTLKPVKGNLDRQSVIKLVKFQPKSFPVFSKLAMPVKFKSGQSDKVQISVTLVNEPKAKSFIVSEVVEEDGYADVPPDDTNENLIPELSPEDIKSSNIPKIVIPNLPAGYKDIHIAHLLPEAPFFKIVKVNEVLNANDTEGKEEVENEPVELPEGTKLVTANPLEHLLGGKQVSDVFEPHKKGYYKPKKRNYASVVAKAMQKLVMEGRAATSKTKNESMPKSMPVLPVEQ